MPACPLELSPQQATSESSKMAHPWPSPRATRSCEGGPAAPGTGAVRTAVAARLGYDPFVAVAPNIVFVEISGEEDAFRAKIKLVDDEQLVRGVRELSHPGKVCASIIATLALSISIAIDPDSAFRAPGEPPPEIGSAEVEVEEHPVLAPPPAHEPPRRDAPPPPPPAET